MIVPVTSKGGGVGCTTLSVSLALTIKKVFRKKVLLIELTDSQTLSKLLSLDPSQRCIDMLITDIGFSGACNITPEDNIYHYGDSDPRKSIDVLLGTRSQDSTYLYKRVESIKALIQSLDAKYDIILLDIPDGDLLDTLFHLGLVMYPVNVITQEMTLIVDYQQQMKAGSLRGAVIVNILDRGVYPRQDEFLRGFNNNPLFFLSYNPEIRDILNTAAIHHGVIDFTRFTKLHSFYNELKKISALIMRCSNKEEEKEKIKENSEEAGLKKSKSFWLFRR